MNRPEVAYWLRETDPGRLEKLWAAADDARQQHVGHEVHLRGLVELSNHCCRLCAYCGLRAANRTVSRYRMNAEAIWQCVRHAVELGLGTVVLQAGEDHGLSTQLVADLVRRIKSETPCAVTLSLGERGRDELAIWRAAGADRYLLRFETANARLYREIHPDIPGQQVSRAALLEHLRVLGYEVGSGAMVGLPGQSYDDLTAALLWFRELDLDMVGLGPYIPHPDTPMGRGLGPQPLAPDMQVPGSESMTYKTIALTRLLCPEINIPATTALATLNPRSGYELGLLRGANVIMPNVTPRAHRDSYDVYPGKTRRLVDRDALYSDIRSRVRKVGRVVGSGPGSSPHYRRRAAEHLQQRESA